MGAEICVAISLANCTCENRLHPVKTLNASNYVTSPYCCVDLLAMSIDGKRIMDKTPYGCPVDDDF